MAGCLEDHTSHTQHDEHRVNGQLGQPVLTDSPPCTAAGLVLHVDNLERCGYTPPPHAHAYVNATPMHGLRVPCAHASHCDSTLSQADEESENAENKLALTSYAPACVPVRVCVCVCQSHTCWDECCEWHTEGCTRVLGLLLVDDGALQAQEYRHRQAQSFHGQCTDTAPCMTTAVLKSNVAPRCQIWRCKSMKPTQCMPVHVKNAHYEREHVTRYSPLVRVSWGPLAALTAPVSSCTPHRRQHRLAL